MRKLFWQISVTLDGFIEGPNRELDHTAGFQDPEFDHYASAMLQSIDGMLLGRKTYQLFLDYWPFATGPDAERMNQLPKYIFSRSLKEVGWNNSRLVRGSVQDQVANLKEQAGNDLAVFGSAELASDLIRLGLIDEYRILVTPVVLGAGTPMWRAGENRLNLELSKVEPWSSGTVALFYRPQPTDS